MLFDIGGVLVIGPVGGFEERLADPEQGVGIEFEKILVIEFVIEILFADSEGCCLPRSHGREPGREVIHGLAGLG